jgi:hypothetical protein
VRNIWTNFGNVKFLPHNNSNENKYFEYNTERINYFEIESQNPSQNKSDGVKIRVTLKDNDTELTKTFIGSDIDVVTRNYITFMNSEIRF